MAQKSTKQVVFKSLWQYMQSVIQCLLDFGVRELTNIQGTSNLRSGPNISSGTYL